MAGRGGPQGQGLLVDGAVGIQGHWHEELCQGYAVRGWWPQELGRSGRPQGSRQRALAGSRLGCGWQGALARRQLAVTAAAHLVFHSSPDHRPARHFPHRS